jgi:hypothetical protein
LLKDLASLLSAQSVRPLAEAVERFDFREAEQAARDLAAEFNIELESSTCPTDPS